MRVIVRVDAGPLIGGGHAMRCLTLADALARRSAEVTFVTAAMPRALVDRIEAAGHSLQFIPASHEIEREGADWHETPLSARAQAADLAATRQAAGSGDWLVVDHYLLDALWHSAARDFAHHVLVIDDLANRQYDCDLLLDQTFGRDPADYRALLPASAKVLAGPAYALLRPEFEHERRAALDRRKKVEGPERILVSMGTADMGGVTATIVPEVLAAAPDCQVDVVLGPDAPSLDRVRRLAAANRRLKLHLDSRNMAELMRDADLAIGAAGTTSWERCCLGLPTIAMALAENQRPTAMALAEADAIVAVPDPEEVGSAVRSLFDDPRRLAQMSAAAFAICDGHGTERVLTAMFGQEQAGSAEVRLRPAEVQDAEILWLWRNDLVTRVQSRSTEPISWKAHIAWLTAALADPARKIMMAEHGTTPVGTVGLHRIDDEWEISITVAPETRGGGIGTAILQAACDRTSHDIYASVRNGNRGSRRLFESRGFKAIESTETGFVRYLRSTDDHRRKQA